MEVTAYGSMNNIFEYGCYRVGGKRATCMLSSKLSDMISLHFKGKDIENRLTKTNYNLEELRDLESKLVLITGSNAENRKKVELFINVSIIPSFATNLVLYEILIIGLPFYVADHLHNSRMKFFNSCILFLLPNKKTKCQKYNYTFCTDPSLCVPYC